MRTILNAAVQDGALPANPCQIKGAGSAHHPERPTASPDEVDELAKRMPPELGAAVVVAAWSGTRYGEPFALARRNVDLDAGAIRIDRALICLPGQPITFGVPKTQKSTRTIHLPEFVLDRLAAHMEQYTASDSDALVFAMSDGSPVTNARVSYTFRRARAAIDRGDLTWHDLRHTGATLAYRAGTSVPEVKDRLGHTTMRAASIYAHRADDSDRILADRLNEMFGARDES